MHNYVWFQLTIFIWPHAKGQPRETLFVFLFNLMLYLFYLFLNRAAKTNKDSRLAQKLFVYLWRDKQMNKQRAAWSVRFKLQRTLFEITAVITRAPSEPVYRFRKVNKKIFIITRPQYCTLSNNKLEFEFVSYFNTI